MKLQAASIWKTLWVRQGASKKQLAHIVSTGSPASSCTSKELLPDSHAHAVHTWCHLPSAKDTKVLFSGLRKGLPLDAKQKRFSHSLNFEPAKSNESHEYSSSKLGQWIAKAVILATFVLFGSSRAQCETLKSLVDDRTCSCPCACRDRKHLPKRNYTNHAECSHHSQECTSLNSSLHRFNPLQKIDCLQSCSLCNKSLKPVISHNDSDVDYHPSIQMDGNSLKKLERQEALDNAIGDARILLKKALNVAGSPSLVVGVSVDGMLVWSEGIGRCNMETGDGCYADSMFRIASISKPLTATLALSLWEDGLLDLDKPVREYLGDEWPVKTVDGEQVDITARHLLSHTSGIRHYNLSRPKRNGTKNGGPQATTNNNSKTSGSNGKAKTPRSFEEVEKLLSSSPSSVSSEEFNNYVIERRRRLSSRLNSKPFRDSKKEIKKKEQKKTDLFEYYINQQCDSVKEAVELFKDDDLFFKPGTDFLYSSHGYTLLSRVLEVVTGKRFPDLAASLFQDLDMTSTTLDRPDEIVFGRVPMYERDEHHVLRNVPYVDNSYKWAGGGFLSSAIDLTTFGTAVLFAFQTTNHHIVSPSHQVVPGYLRSSTVRQMWTPHWFQPEGQALVGNQVKGYGLGWCLRVPRPDYQVSYRICNKQKKRSNRLDSAPSLDEESSSSQSSSSDVAAAAASNDHVAVMEEDGCFAGHKLENADASGRVTVKCSSPASMSSRTGESAALHASLDRLGSDATADGTIRCSDSIIRCKGSSNSPEAHESYATTTNDASNNVGDAAESFNQSASLTNNSQYNSSNQRSSTDAQWSNDSTVAGRSHRGYCNCPGLLAFHTGAAVGGSSVLLIAPRLCSPWKIERLDEEGKPEQENLGSKEDSGNRSGEPAEGQTTSNVRSDNDRAKNAYGADKTIEDNGNGEKKKVKVHRRAVLKEPTIKECPVCRKKFKPSCGPARGDVENSRAPPGGVVVAILSNYTGVNFTKEAIAISELFRMVRPVA